MEKEIYGYTSYKKALEWYKENNRVNLTNLRDLDYELNQTINDKYEKDDNTIYQTFVTDYDESETNFLSKTFGLLFEYSKLLGKYILLVDHFGTSWECIKQPVYNRGWWKENKDEYAYQGL